MEATEPQRMPSSQHPVKKTLCSPPLAQSIDNSTQQSDEQNFFQLPLA